MTIFLFFITRPEIRVKEYPGIIADTIETSGAMEFSLYAYTGSKINANYFRATRNMEIFQEKEMEVDDEEFESFIEEHPDYLLEYHLLTTKSFNNDKVVSVPINILMTRMESDQIVFYQNNYFERILDEDIDETILTPILENKIFKKYIRRILNKYFAYDDIVTATLSPYDDNDAYKGYLIDQLSLYIRLFSNTYKGGLKI